MPLNRPALALDAWPAWRAGRATLGDPGAHRDRSSRARRVRRARRLRARHQRAAARRAADQGAGARHPRAPAHRGPRRLPGAAGPAGPRRSSREDDLLLTFGRGLRSWPACSIAWGAEIEDDGKIVWFVPAGGAGRRRRRPGHDHRRVPRAARGRPPVVEDPVDVLLDGLPLVGDEVQPDALPRAAPRAAAAGARPRGRLPARQAPLDLFFTDLDAAFCARACATRAWPPQLLDGDDRAGPDHHRARAERRRLRALHRAPRPRRRLLPRRSGCCPWPARPSSVASRPGSSASSCARPSGADRRAGGAPGAAEPAPERLVTRPAPRRCCSRWRSAARSAALLRWWLGDLVPDGDGFPWTTFAINVAGSLRARAAAGLRSCVRRRPALAAGLGPGVLGGYTTLSTYAEQGRALLADGRAGLAAAYLLGTLAACLLAVALAGRLSTPLAQRGVRGRGGQRVTPLLVALGAAVGAALRFWVGHHLDGRLPWGTLLVNVAGSFVLGLFVGAVALGEPRAGAARHRLLRRPHDVLRLRGADPRPRGRARRPAYAAATIVLALAACAGSGRPCCGLAASHAGGVVRAALVKQASGSGVAEVVQAGVVDAEVVGDLVHDGDPDLLDELLHGRRTSRAAGRGR